MATKKYIRVLALDPGLMCTGWVILDYYPEDAGRIIASKIGTFSPNKVASKAVNRDNVNQYGLRMMSLLELENNLDALLVEYNPDYIAVEDIFFNPTRPTAFLALAQWMTILDRKLYNYQKIAYKIPTKSAKKFTTGTGGSDKVNVQKAIVSNTNVEFKQLQVATEMIEHEADAVAIGYTFIMERLQALLISVNSVSTYGTIAA